MSEFLKDPTLERLAALAVTGLVAAVVALWRRDVSRSNEAAREAREAKERAEHEAKEWRTKWAEEIKRSSVDAERFLRVLEKRRSGSSGPPSR